MERAEGRNRSEINELDCRLQDLNDDISRLSSALPEGSAGEGALRPSINVETRAYLFTLESFAATLFLRLRAELFESRLGMPRNDAEVFSILQQHALLDPSEARKLRQFCEARFLSTRDLKKLDYVGLSEMSADRGWILSTLARLAK